MSAFSEVYDHGAWRVVHTLSSGHVYERGVQYDLRDATASFNDGSTKPTWIGVLRRNSSISMTGSLGMRGATLTYDETMTQNGQILVASELTCRLDGSWQTPAPRPSSPLMRRRRLSAGLGARRILSESWNPTACAICSIGSNPSWRRIRAASTLSLSTARAGDSPVSCRNARPNCRRLSLAASASRSTGRGSDK
jgi:hypothetical protein